MQIQVYFDISGIPKFFPHSPTPMFSAGSIRKLQCQCMQWAGQAVVEVPGGPDHGPLHCDVVDERKETRRTRSVYRHFYLDVDLLTYTNKCIIVDCHI